jgi:outer membrane protein assembly factor BamA
MDSVNTDTLITGKNGEYTIFYNKKIKYKTRILLDAIFIRKGDLYKFKNVEATYKRLSEIKVFKFINVVFKETRDGKLDCYIQLSPLLKQSLTLESEGTNTSGYLGISGSVVYQNKNLVKGAELLELKLKGGISAQPILNDQSTKNIASNSTFNTIEIGPELNIYLPRFWLPFKVAALSKLTTPKTVFTSGLNYQRRDDYTRLITNFSLGYTWKESSKKQHAFYPVVINFVKVELQPFFKAQLDAFSNNKYLLNTFSNHLSTSTRYSYTYNGQNLQKQKSFSFFKLNLEASGNVLRGLYNVINEVEPNTFVKDGDSYTFLNIAYSQYVRADAEYRYYFDLHELGKVVFRVAGGIGRALANYKVLPFERSFFSGGTNGLRAWQSRTIGPGSYSEHDGLFSYVGDGQLEANIEHRFKIFKMLNGALFVDAGNVWLRNPDSQYPGGDFQLNRFYKEIAIGTGLGLRVDFNFFVIRLDMGIKTRDPQFAENDRWVLPYLFNRQWKQDYQNSYDTKYHFVVFNLGIGYPF